MNEIYLNYVKTNKIEHRIFKNFANTQSLRETSDYSAVVDIDERTARLKISHAEEFIKKAEELLSQK